MKKMTSRNPIKRNGMSNEKKREKGSTHQYRSRRDHPICLSRK